MIQIQQSPSLVLSVLLVCFFGGNVLATESHDDVIVSYDATLDLPDSIAFRQFLELLEPVSSEVEAPDLQLVGRAVGIDSGESGAFGQLDHYAQLFMKSGASVKRETADRTRKFLCRSDRKSMSLREIGDAMNAANRISNQVAEKYLSEVKAALPKEQEIAFVALLDEIKLATTYTRFDHNKKTPNLRREIEEWCSELQNEKSNLGTG